jgi:hypothetical protein
MTQMELACGTVASQYYFSHIKFYLFPVSARKVTTFFRNFAINDG